MYTSKMGPLLSQVRYKSDLEITVHHPSPVTCLGSKLITAATYKLLVQVFKLPGPELDNNILKVNRR